MSGPPIEWRQYELASGLVERPDLFGFCHNFRNYILASWSKGDWSDRVSEMGVHGRLGLKHRFKQESFLSMFLDRDEIRPLWSSVLYLLSAICLSINCLTVICLSVNEKIFCFWKSILIYKMIIAKTALYTKCISKDFREPHWALWNSLFACMSFYTGSEDRVREREATDCEVFSTVKIKDCTLVNRWKRYLWTLYCKVYRPGN